MLRFHFTKLQRLTIALAMFSIFVGTPVSAQDSGENCRYHSGQNQPNDQLDGGRAQLAYPTYFEDRFPEFPASRETAPRYRSVAPRGVAPLVPTSGQSRDLRDERYQQYRPDYNAPQQRRDYGRPSRRQDFPSTDGGRRFNYSGFDIEGDYRSRPTERRYRSPLENRGSDDLRNLRDRLENEYRSAPRSRRSNYRDAAPQDRSEPVSRPRQPERRESQGPTLDQKVTARYSDPNVVRFATSLNSNQGLALFREISTLIDQRHLSPKSYSERMDEGVRSVQVALQNRTFQSAVRLGSDRGQQFGSTLGRLNVRGVRNRTEAEQFVQTAMQAGSRLGMRPGLIAYEFANASIQSLDRFSALDPSLNRVSGQVDDTETRTAQILDDEYVTGVGIEVRHHADGLEIVRALTGGPAVQAGIRGGDIIRAIDGREIGGTEMNTSVSMISGSVGTPVRFLVERESRGTKTFTLVRRRFRVYTVNDVKMLDRQTGYMHLGKFARNSTSEMERAIQELRSQGMRNLVVDVRGNPGGLLTTAIEISDKFLRCGRIVATRGRLASDNMVETATATGTWSMPLVVLVDKDSASASEIFAAAIQENGRGLVVGERSYGKGTVQTHFPLSSGLGTVRLTTAKFYSPTDREMSGAGVTPDVRSSGEKDALSQALTAASHPRLAEMVAEHGTCRPAGQNFRNFGSAAKPADSLTAVLGN